MHDLKMTCCLLCSDAEKGWQVDFPNSHPQHTGMSVVECHDPSHGGFYMAEGAFYIRIGLLPCVVSGDRLALSHCGLIDRYLHCRRAHPMSHDWGCTSMSYHSPYVLPFVYAALGAIL